MAVSVLEESFGLSQTADRGQGGGAKGSDLAPSPPPLPLLPPPPWARPGGDPLGLREGAGLLWVFEFQMRVTIKQLDAVSPGFKLSSEKAGTLCAWPLTAAVDPESGALL